MHVNKGVPKGIIEASIIRKPALQWRGGHTMPAISESDARARLGEVPGWDVGEKLWE
jgi:hypothetical protein